MRLIKVFAISAVFFLAACSDEDPVPVASIPNQPKNTDIPLKKIDKDRSIKTDYPVTRITDNVYEIYGLVELPNEKNQAFRNNLAFIVSKAGVIVIDTGSSVYIGEFLLKKIRSVTDKPVVAVFITHSHGDHWLGNGAIKKAFPKAVIYSHPKTRNMAKEGEGERWIKILNDMTNGAIEGTPVAIPDKDVADGELIEFGDIKLVIHHAGKAHTDTDIIIEVKDKGIVFTGDIVRDRMVSLMRDGSFKGNITAAEKLIGLGAKYYIPGHGQVGDVDMVKRYRGYQAGLYAAVKKYYSEDMSDFEMKPKIVELLSDYKDWSGFEEYIGPHISQAFLEIEAEEF